MISGGKNFAPQPIENELNGSPFIGVPIVRGDRHKFIAAVIVTNFDRLREHVNSSNWSVDWTKLYSEPVIRALSGSSR